MRTLPRIMVAPTGARKTKADHPNLPIDIADVAETARLSQLAGAEALHAHVRNADGGHSLDAGLYRELLAEVAARAPDLAVQITTEAVGIYAPEDQRAVVRAVMPEMASVAMVEQVTGDDDVEARAFYHWAWEAGIHIQHILYAPDQVPQFLTRLKSGFIPAGSNAVIFVLGHYSTGKPSEIATLDEFLAMKGDAALDWGVCAFGQPETECLVSAASRGGKMRIGFENNHLNANGEPSASNEERVAELVQALQVAGC